ncbi:MAG: hypothetical protein WCH34_15775 [Bacteroidota bacterium]
MKKLFFFLMIALMAMNANAKVWRLNNNPGISADFNNWAAAYAAASAGDTIYIEGSLSSYGNITLNKPLIIIGAGYFLDQNLNTQKYPYYASIVNYVYVNIGSEGSYISGLTFNNDIQIYCQNISIVRNYFPSSSINFSQSNTIIKQNYITGCILTNTKSNNNIIKNNVVRGSYYPLNLGDSCIALISNNNLYGYYCCNKSNNCIYTNNIIQNLSFYNINNNTFSHNICDYSQLPVGNGNQLNVNMSTVYVGTGTSDGQWQLKVGSPAIGAGIGGTDCGIFGGDEPYVLSGMPGIPSVYVMTTSGMGNNSTGLNMHVKAKAH